ncbi:MAG: TolC family protein [Bacteroidia bacterium]|nr:TolC family protein [Bacteroidia bacterium]MDW8158784.1 TolC family protein [Bacteroidia bacterium]
MKTPLFLITLALLLVHYLLIKAQPKQILTLQDCIDLALERNLQLQLQKNAVESAQLNFLQSKMSYLPTINATLDYRNNFGITFDFLQFQRVARTTSFSNPTLVLSTPLFNGFFRYYTLQQNLYNLQAAGAALNRVQNEVLTNVLALYLQLIIDKGNIEIAQKRKELLAQQLKRVQDLYESGRTTKAEPLNIQAQIANETLNLVNLQNLYQRNLFNLLQLLRLDIDTEYEIEIPPLPQETFLKDPLPPLSEILENAQQNMPEILEQKLRITANAYNVKAAKAALQPTLNLNAGLASNFSSNGGIPVYEFQTINIAGYEFPVARQLKRIDRASYFAQIEDNFSQFINFSLNIPIYNGYRARTNLQQAELAKKNAELNLQVAQNNLARIVQQAYLDAQAAKARYETIEQQLAATLESFKIAEIQYAAGSINFYAYLENLNNKTRLETELKQTLYDYYFRRKILDIYNGKTITLD